MQQQAQAQARDTQVQFKQVQQQVQQMQQGGANGALLFPRERHLQVEVGNALSARNRQGAVQFIRQCYRTENMIIISVDTDLLAQALSLYQSRSDKTWGLTDCISFIVMQANQLTTAVTSDRHFRQAGFLALMTDP